MKSEYGEPGAPIAIVVETLADGAQLVLVRGEVDLSTAPYLQEALDDVARGTNHDVLVELSADFIDSTGLHVLIRAAQRLRAIGRLLRVTTENPHIQSVIEITGLTEELCLGARDATSNEPSLP